MLTGTERPEAAAPGSRPIKAAFFSLLPDHNIATRAWCLRPLPFLREHGIEAHVYPPSSSAVFRRFQAPGGFRKLLFASLYWYGLVLPRRLTQIVSALSCDVIFIQRGLLRYKSPPILEAMLFLVAGKLLGRRIIYHLDDAQWAGSRAGYFRFRCRHADVVITGSTPIVDFARAAGADVVRIQYSVESSRFQPKRHTPTTPVVIGYTGLFPDEHLAPIVHALSSVCAEGTARVKVVSERRYHPPELAGQLDWETYDLSRETELFDDFDIGILPLPDTEFNRGKESYKLKEYMASGLPIVCSPVGHNKEFVTQGVDGFLAETEAEWIEYLGQLVADPVLRTKLGANGRRLVQERHTPEAQADALAAVLLGDVSSKESS